ncbi:polyprenyl synthetase family protein [Nocardia brasiliensis]|uniref:polyprenyl synthetase family protein n=1 Tax=Nocardia brasiliensis TaxID=37326 RepID=UPI001894EA99|nr:polyprenyl synthetase family protein [Nocardia brasiliensis]MBF6124711.1 polyprenyl synthetase family protein [Nocardia brasiliensis]
MTAVPSCTRLPVSGQRSRKDAPELDAGALLVAAREQVEPLLRAAVDGLAAPLRRMAGYHFGWWDAEGCPTGSTRGKGLRAALTFASARAWGADAAVAAPAAAAVELLHNFTLIHDDVMDGDQLRRGRATVWRVWGVSDAVLLGDALHALSTRVLLGSPDRVAGPAVALMASTALDLCAGQHVDCACEHGGGVDVADYLSMASGKTGALLGAACALGGLYAGADDASVAALETYGRETGIAFQIIDDLLGIWGDAATTGKVPGNDLARRKRTLPVIAALESDHPAAAELAGLYFDDRVLSKADLARVAELVEQAGGMTAARQLAEQHRLAAMAALPSFIDLFELRILGSSAINRNR